MPVQKYGRYDVIRFLGRGGMAVVYLAYDPIVKREVAIKVLPSQLTADSDFRSRLEREVQTIARLEHPCIVPVYDYGEEDDQPYVVMRYMSGGSLLNRIKQKPLTPAELSSVMGRLARALDKVHARNIIHRDVKPANILFDDQDQAYLSDFGIAKVVEDSATKTGTATIGTLAYMSPEQGSGNKKLDGRSDIYALGIIVFEALTGQQPYQADTPVGLLLQHVTKEIPNIRQLRPDLAAEYEIVIQQAMAKAPEMRYPKASDLADDLVMIADGKKIKARPDLQGDATEPAPGFPAEAAVIDPPTVAHQPLVPSAEEEKYNSRQNKGSIKAFAILGLVLLSVGIAATIFFLNSGGDNLPSPTLPSELEVAGGIETSPTASSATASIKSVNVPAEKSSATYTPMPSATNIPVISPTGTPIPSASFTPIQTSTPVDTATPIFSTPTVALADPTLPAEPSPTIVAVTDYRMLVDNFEDYGGNSVLNDVYQINAAWGANAGNLKLVGSPHAAEGQQALAFEYDITNPEPDNYSGFERRLFPQDWSGFSFLCFWIESDGSGNDLIVQFGESDNEVWKRTVALSTLDQQELCSSLSKDDFVWADWSTEGNNQIDLATITYYGFFVEGIPQGPGTVYIDNLRLAKPTPTPSPTSSPTPTRAPSPTPVVVVCANEFEGEFRILWERHKGRLGCPQQKNPATSFVAEQPFENGHMYWVENGDFYLVVIGDQSGSWRFFPGNDSIWKEGMPEKSCDIPTPPGLFHPIRGFGGLWCAQNDIREQIGWGLKKEEGFQPGIDLVQGFDGGIIFRDSDGFSRGLAYIMFQDDGTFIQQQY